MPRETGLTFIIGAVDKFTAPFRSFNDKLEESTRGLARVREGFGALGAERARLSQMSGFASLSRATSNIGKQFGQITQATSAFAVKAGVAAGVAGLGFKTQFLDVAAQFEKFESILTTLNRGDKGKAKEQMGWISDFAAKTPYELAEVTDAFVKLRSYGLDPTKGLLQVLGDTASSMGKPLEMAVEAIADAVTGENERLKEFGIVAKKTGEKIVYEYTNAAGKQTKLMAKASDRAQIQATLMKIWGEKYGGGMEAQSKTWNGMWSNLMDAWSRFSNMVMGNGVFDWMKTKLGGVLETIEQMSADGRLQAWAKDIGDKLTAFFDAAWNAIPRVWEGIMKFGEGLAWVAELLGGWENMGIAVAALMSGLVAPVLGLAAAFIQLSGVLIATPFGWVVVAIGGLVAALTTLWLKWDKIVEWVQNKVPDWMKNAVFAESGEPVTGDGASVPAMPDMPTIPPMPTLGAAHSASSYRETRTQLNEQRETTIRVQFDQAPPGMRVSTDGAPVETRTDYGMGFSMAHAYGGR